ncbi:MAG TPA: amidohydrolase [Opitutaceae bacterium]
MPRSRTLTRLLATALGLAAGVFTLSAQTTKDDVLRHIDASKAPYEEIALQIWNFAEVGYQETKSSALLQEQLKKEGFTVEAGVAEIPTAFVASYGSGHPIIGILGEFDALPGVSQTADPEKKARPEVAAGHACGHHLFGAGSAAAAVAIKDWMKATGQQGTIRFYGCPAEEGGAGKVYLVRAGLFNDVDTVLHWHAGDRNAVTVQSSLSNKSAKFRFHGQAAHAAAAPERGRSALDGVEAMNMMANLMREHVPASTRMHYVITRGGEAPNVVPAFAEVFYYVRSPSREILQGIWARLEQAARGAAMGTDTKVEWEIIHGAYELLPNEPLARAMQANLETVGGITYTDEEKAFAEKIGRTLYGRPPAVETAGLVQPLNLTPATGSASTDVGDVSWVVPTMGLAAATWVPGTPGHSWQAVACGGTTIGLKGMTVASKTIALTAIDLFTQPGLIAKAKADFDARRGADFHYVSLVGDRKPPLDYRN